MKKTLNNISIIFILICLPKIFMAQQDALYSMYMFDKMLINPAFAGSSNWAVATAKYREQFSGMKGHPTTQTINFHTPIQKKHLGIGFKIINDKIAIINNLNAALLLSYHLNFAGGKLSLGLEAGVFNRKVDYQKTIVTTQEDNSIPKTKQSSLVPDFSYGLYYQKKQCYFGITQYHLLKSKFDFKANNQSKSHLYNQFNFLLGNVFDLSKKFSYEPSILLKIQPSIKPQIDLNVTFYYNDLIGAGIQYRSGDAIVGVLRINILENLKLAYSYDFTISKLSRYTNGNHEIMISYGIKLPPPPSKKEIHPRYYF
jgi:type IX secretion system PorP/SprF family membrane protein